MNGWKRTVMASDVASSAVAVVASASGWQVLPEAVDALGKLFEAAALAGASCGVGVRCCHGNRVTALSFGVVFPTGADKIGKC